MTAIKLGLRPEEVGRTAAEAAEKAGCEPEQMLEAAVSHIMLYLIICLFLFN